MSDNHDDEPNGGDRRVRKTREALHCAFAGLVLHRRYDEIRVGDIVERADVGRSTFYEHYRDKDDMLVQSMSPFFDVFADAAVGAGDPGAVDVVLRHFWENREAARYLFDGPPAREVLPQIVRELSSRIERRLDARVRERGTTPLLPLRLVAMQTAEAQFALIRAWLAGRDACDPETLAEGLRRSSRGATASLAEP